MTESWQIVCPRCRWANSGANSKCAKCGRPLRQAPGMLRAGERLGTARPTTTPRVVQPGGFLPRLIALIVDGLILSLLGIGIYFLWAAQLRPTQVAAGSTVSQLQQQALEQVVILEAALVLVNAFYFIGSWNLLGGSPGMLMLNLRIVDKKGSTLGFGRAFARWFWYTLLGFLAPVSAIMVAVGKDKRAIHDALAGTFVIQYLDADKVAASLPPDPAAAAAPRVQPVYAEPPAPPPVAGAEYASPPPLPQTPSADPLPPPLAPVGSSLDFLPPPPGQEQAGPGHHTQSAPATASPDPYPVPFVPSVVPANGDQPGHPDPSASSAGTAPGEAVPGE